MITTRLQKRKLEHSGERGIALLLCLFALLLLTGLAVAMVYMSDTEQSINNNYRDAQRAYFGAQAGLQEARVWLMAKGASTPSTMPVSGANTGVTYLINSNGSAVQPWSTTNGYFDTELCNENFSNVGVAAVGWNAPCISVPSGTYYKTVTSSDPNTGTSKAMDYKWVRITWKANQSSSPFYVNGTTASDTPICWTGTKQVLKPGAAATCELETSAKLTTVYRLTSLAVAPGGTRRLLQMEVADNPPFITNAAVDSQDHVTLNGKLDVNGFDYCSCDMSKCVTDKSGITTCPSRPNKTCDNTKWAIYASSTVDTANPSENLIAGVNPAVAQNQPWIYDIPALIDSYKDGATDVRGAPYNWNCSGTNNSCGTKTGDVFGIPPAFPPNPPDSPDADPAYGTCVNGAGPGCPKPQVTYIPGDAKLTGGSSGNGILIVDGDLDIHGGLQFYGLILVKGVIKFTGGGSDKTNIFGAVLAGQESYVDNVLGGSAAINFNACALEQNKGSRPPTMINFHEMSY